MLAIDLDADDVLVFELDEDNSIAQGVTLLANGRLVTDGLTPCTYELKVQVKDSLGLVSIGSVFIRVDPMSDGEPALGAAYPEGFDTDIEISEASTSLLTASVAFKPDLNGVSGAQAPLALLFAANEPSGKGEQLELHEDDDARFARLSGSGLEQQIAVFLGGSIQLDELEDNSWRSDDSSLELKTSSQLLLDLLAVLSNALDQLDGMDGLKNQEDFEQRVMLIVGFTTVTTGVVGFTIWLLVSKALFAAAFSTVSIWRGFDPLPIVMAGKDGNEDEKW